MTIYSIQASFGRGELTPKLHSRADIDHFKMGLKTCVNFMVMRQGGIRRRPGTQFIGEVKDSSRPTRVIPFIFSASQAYVLVFNAGVFRVYALGGRVGTVEVAHPYADDELFGLDYDQTNDVLDIAHKNHQPRRVRRAADTAWSIETVPTNDGPYLPINATATSLTPSDTGNAVPDMTSNTTPGGTADASGYFTGGGYDGSPWKAFDGNIATSWFTKSRSGWLRYKFDVAKIIVAYSVQAGSGTAPTDPNDSAATDSAKSWTFEGSQDGATWTVLDSQFGQTSWSDSETRSFTFTNTTAFFYYRLNIATMNGGTYLAVANLTMTESPDNAPAITITASGTEGINGGAGFMGSDVGRLITLLSSDAVYHPFRIVGIASPTTITVKLTGAPLSATQGTLQWRFGAWGATPGWPAHVATFEGRKVYARTSAQPSGIWATKSGGYGTALDFSVSVPIKDDDAISFTLADVNEIQWIAEGTDLLIGTAGAARTMGRDSPNLPFSANNFRQSLASTYASQAVRPVKVGGSTIFASKLGKALREFVQSDNGIGYDTPDISVLSEHLFATGIQELCYAQEPDSVVWLPGGDGTLIGLTYEKAQAMAGMHRHRLGGDGFVESCGTIPGTDRNEVWMVVRRSINGAAKRYIERMAAPFESATTAPAEAWFVDCGLRYAGTPATVVTGLSHLEGQAVSILADGAREADQVVTGGAASLASGRAASTVIVGLSYRSHARTLPSPLSQGDGSGLGRRKKVVSAKADLLASGPVKLGRNTMSAEQINHRRSTDDLGAPPGLYTGFVDARPETGWSEGGEIEIIADGPQPCTVRSITLALEPEP